MDGANKMRQGYVKYNMMMSDENKDSAEDGTCIIDEPC